MKIFKIFLTIVVILLLFILIVLFISLRPVDRSPFHDSKYYRSTLQQLSKTMINLPKMGAAALQVGTGKAGLTPRVGTPLAGYSDRKGAPSIGVHDSLYVRTIALQSGDQLVCILGYDALVCPTRYARIIEDSVRFKYGLNKEQLLFTATHTHSGPGGWGQGWVEEQFSGPPDSHAQGLFVQNTLRAIQQALDNKSPASLQYGSINIPHLIRNRLLKDRGKIDDELVYAAFSRESKLIAVFATYSAHATVLSAKNMLFSGDYPGFFERKIESETNALVIFAAAGVGSHGPRIDAKNFDQARLIGNTLADSLLVDIDKSEEQKCHIMYFQLPVQMPEPQIRISQDYRLAPWLARFLMNFENPYLQIIGLNNLLIFGTPADFSGELVLILKEYAKSKNFHVTVTSFNGSYVGYMTPSKYDSLDSYETQLMSFFGPYTGDYFLDIMKHIVDDLRVL